jgi:hypothetical protein
MQTAEPKKEQELQNVSYISAGRIGFLGKGPHTLDDIMDQKNMDARINSAPENEKEKVTRQKVVIDESEKHLANDELAKAMASVWQGESVVVMHYDKEQWEQSKSTKQEWMEGSDKGEMGLGKDSKKGEPVDEVYQVFKKKDGKNVLMFEARMQGENITIRVDPKDPKSVEAALRWAAAHAKGENPTITIQPSYDIGDPKNAKILFDMRAKVEAATGKKITFKAGGSLFEKLKVKRQLARAEKAWKAGTLGQEEKKPEKPEKGLGGKDKKGEIEMEDLTKKKVAEPKVDASNKAGPGATPTLTQTR